jgi:predicted GTPase
MNATPRGLRPHIILAGPCNGGKSSLLNAVMGQDVALVSEHAGTTTDPVYKNMELLPFGPVTFVDTPGLDDATALGQKRVGRSKAAITGADLAVYIARPSQVKAAGGVAAALAAAGLPEDIPVSLVFTHQDLAEEAALGSELAGQAGLPLPAPGAPAGPVPAPAPGASGQPTILAVSSTTGAGIDAFKDHLVARLSGRKHEERKLLENLVKPGQLVIMVVPIDLEAPAGRLILPQVQAIREALDADSGSLVVKEREIDWALSLLKTPPALAITDSQVVLKAAAAIPEGIPLTTFSILFSRQKGDLEEFVKAARVIDTLRDGDRVIIAETCSHKQLCDDIGRVKIPRWLRQYTGCELEIQTVSGALPPDTAGAKLIIHCGGCMITRRMMLSRLGSAAGFDVPVTNYGVAISYCQGVLDRVVRPFGL